MTYISISISSSSFSDSSMVCQLDRFDWSPSSSMVCQLDRFDWSPSDSSIVCQLGRFDWLIDWLIDHTDDGLCHSNSSMVSISETLEEKQHLSQENRFEIKIWF